MKKYTGYVVFTLVGLTAIAWSAATDSTANPTIHDVLLNLGLVAIAVVVIEALWRLAGGNPAEDQVMDFRKEISRLSQHVDIIQKTRAVGLHSVYDCTASFGKANWMKLIQESTATFDVMGRALSNWVRPHEIDDLIANKIVKDGVTFRWLIMSEENSFLRLLEEEGTSLNEKVRPKLSMVYQRLWEIRDHLEKKSSESLDKLKVRVFSNVPLYCSLVRSDDLFLVTPYLSSADAQDCPLYCFRGERSPWAAATSTEFDQIWWNATDLFSLPRLRNEGIQLEIPKRPKV